MMSQKIGCLEACFTVSWIVVLTELGRELERKSRGYIYTKKI